MSVAIEIVGDDAGILEMLHTLDTALNPVALAGFLSDGIAPYLQGRAQDRFSKEGDDVTGPWAPLSPSTVEIREQLGFGGSHPINVREGELIEFVTQAPANAAVNPWGASLTLPGTPPMGELAAKLEHAQKGGTSDSGQTYPARPVLGMNEVDLMFVLTTLARYIETVGNARIG